MQGISTSSFRALAHLSLIVGCALATAIDSYTTLTSTTTIATSTTTIFLTVSRAIPSSTPSTTEANMSPPTQARLLASSSPTPSASPSTTMSTSSLESEVLNSTNWYRENYEASPIVWNTTLAEYATAYAQNCIWKHSGGPYGENLASSFPSITLAINAWGREESAYNYGKASFTERNGHFTQLVWQETTQVGCGLAQCENTSEENGVKGAYLVCEYWPRGNVKGAFKENVEKPGMDEEDGKLGLGEGGAHGLSDGLRTWTLTLVAVYVVFVLCFLC